MSFAASRILARNLHIFAACLQMLLLYSPLHHWPHTVELMRWGSFPLLLLSGLWLRKGAVIFPRLRNLARAHA